VQAACSGGRDAYDAMVRGGGAFIDVLRERKSCRSDVVTLGVGVVMMMVVMMVVVMVMMVVMMVMMVVMMNDDCFSFTTHYFQLSARAATLCPTRAQAVPLLHHRSAAPHAAAILFRLLLPAAASKQNV
jgi:hypothetical protein